MSLLTRRSFLQAAGITFGAPLVRAQQTSSPSSGATQDPSDATDRTAGTVRDRLWVWSHPAGSYDTARNKNEWPFSDYGFTRTSRMTPAEGALYLGIPNVIFLRYVGRPVPSDLEPYARMLRPFKRVVWSINLTARRDGPPQLTWTSTDEEEHRVLRDLLRRFPNIMGLIMDDYFRTPGEKRTAAGLDAVRGFKQSFDRPPNPLKAANSLRHAELWDAIYTVDIEGTSKEHLQIVDVMTLWTREAKELVRLEESFEKSCRLFPQTRKVLGCYLWDFLGGKRPIPLPLIKHQCELGLQWLKAGRIEGICFIGTPMCDMGVEAVEWTREWIRRVDDQRL